MQNPSLSGLSIYPVKSCRGIELKKSAVEAFGLKNDRRWMVVDEHGVMLTQRKIAAMCLLNTKLTENALILQHSTMDDLTVNIPAGSETISVKVWADYCDAYDAGNAAAKWLSQILQKKCRLVYFPEGEFRQVDLDYASVGDKTAFSDGFPLLLISQASLDDLNSRLVKPISMNRFRPNIVVQGCESFAEDDWKKIRIGSVIFKLVKPCSRCVIPSINIETAQREDEPTKILRTYRQRENKIFFGQNLIAENIGEIELGARVEIIE